MESASVFATYGLGFFFCFLGLFVVVGVIALCVEIVNMIREYFF